MSRGVAAILVLVLGTGLAVTAAGAQENLFDPLDDDPLPEGASAPSTSSSSLAENLRRLLPDGDVLDLGDEREGDLLAGAETATLDGEDADDLDADRDTSRDDETVEISTTAARLRPARDIDAEDDDPGRIPADYRATGFESDLKTVRERERPELDPIGLRAATFTIFPSIEVTAGHTDNLFRSSLDPKSDSSVTLRPALLARSDWSRHSLVLEGNGEWTSYARYPSEDVLKGSLSADGRLDITRFLAAGLRLTYAADQEGRSSPDAIAGAAEPSRFDTYGAEATLAQRFNRLVATLRGAFSFTDYDDVPLTDGGKDNNDDRDVETNLSGLRLAYEVSPAVEVYADTSFDRREYRQSIDDAGFARSSSGWRGALGTRMELGRLARLDLEAGYVTREYDDPRLERLNDLTLDGRIAWAVTPLTTIRLRGATEIGETTVPNASAELTRIAAIGIDHELLRHFIVSGDLTYQNRIIEGTTSETDTITAAMEGEYRLSREASIVARFSHETERPNDNTGDIRENVVSVGVKLHR